jgi:hypothetical protein
MSHLETLARHGLKTSVLLWLEPKAAITDEIRKLVRENRSAIIQELLAAEVSTPAAQPEPAEHLFPANGDWPFISHVDGEAMSRVDAIRDEALQLGWSEAALYQNRGRHPFPYGQDYGLVCFLSGNRRVGKVSREHIEIVCRQPSGGTYRHYNLNVPQPWIARSDSQNSYTESTTLPEKRR